MPQMGYDMKEGKVVRWHKQEGDKVARGEVIAEIETDKATVEMEAYASGVLRKIVASEGVMVNVGQVIGVIGDPHEQLPPIEELLAPSGEAPMKAAPSQVQEAGAKAPTTPGEEIKASPIARRMAQEKGIDLKEVTGTGPGGRITEKDVLASEEQRKISPLPEKGAPTERAAHLVKLSRMRQAIARLTTRSKREAPHFYLTSEIDMTAAMELRQQLNKALNGKGVHISLNDMLVKAASLTLIKYPDFNSFFQDDQLQINPSINIGIAIALDDGLVIPAVLDCGPKSLEDIAQATKDLVERAQKGVLSAEEYTTSTFSISNLGMFDIDSFTAIIYPPHSAVLAVGTVRKQPVVRDGSIVIAQVMKATLSVDHRVVDGAQGARFIVELKRLLENPGLLLA